MRNRNKVKLSDIAQACGVGASTVSRVLNDVSEGFSVKPEIRKSILATARQMNYVPNVMAKNLRTSKTGNILIFGFKFSWTSIQSMYGYVLETCTDLLIDKGYTVNAVFTPSERLKPELLMTDGAILLTAEDELMISKLNSANIPYVVINGSLDDSCSWIDIDDYQGTKLAMKHLFERGHRRIAYCGPLEELVHATHKSIQIRRNVYAEMMQDAGFECLEFNNEEDPVEIAGKIRDRNCTAALVYNHNHAELIRSVYNFICPKDKKLELITFGSMMNGKSMDIGSVRPDFSEIGRTTVEFLLDSIKNNRSYHKTFEQSLYTN